MFSRSDDLGPSLLDRLWALSSSWLRVYFSQTLCILPKASIDFRVLRVQMLVLEGSHSKELPQVDEVLDTCVAGAVEPSDLSDDSRLWTEWLPWAN